MTTRHQPTDDEVRARHLEALFADEPFLSPTMKARRIHDKMQEMRAAESSAARPVRAAAVTRSFWMEREELMPKRAEPPPAGPRMSFAEAIAHLRQPIRSAPDGGLDPADPISRFRSEMLYPWVQQVGRREIERRG